MLRECFFSGLRGFCCKEDFIYSFYVVFLIIFLFKSEAKKIDLMGTDYYFSLSFPVRKMYLFPKLSPSGCVLKVGVYELGVQVVLSHPEILL